MTDRVLTPAKYPNLDSEGYSRESPPDRAYNCIAWAAGDTTVWWWPDAAGNGYWPAGCPREVTVDAFCRAFTARGYADCPDGSFEPGYEKVALYALGGAPKHAARQLDGGEWTSKMGQYIDIVHSLRAIEGPHYGYVVKFFKRPRRL